MLWERFENAVKVSSAPAEAIPLFVPYDPRNEHDIDSIEALGP
jgi:hypothetical protein